MTKAARPPAEAGRPNSRPKRRGKGRLRHLAANLWSTRGFRVTIISLGSILGAFAVAAWLMTYTDTYRRMPESAWKNGNIKTIGELSALLSPEEKARIDSVIKSGGATATAPTPLVAAGARRWVGAINETNPGAVEYHEADSYGNIYLVPGGWWDEANDDHKVLALEGFGTAWRTYFRQQFPEARADEGRPGVYIVAETGRVAQNIDGKIELLRRDGDDQAATGTSETPKKPTP